MDYYKNLLKEINTKKSTIGIIGLGYVGLPLSILFANKGYKTIGFDIDQKKVKKLNQGSSYIYHISEVSIKKIIDNGFYATSNFSVISDLDIIIICVPTPLNKNNEPDMSFIEETLELISPYMKLSQLIILESTTYPGTTEEYMYQSINGCEPSNSSSKIEIGNNFFLGYSPEREDPGNINFSTKNIPKIVSGISKKCLELTKAVYDKIVETTVPVSSTKVAEMTKIVENVQRAINIGLINELKIVSNKLNIDINEVIDAASTKPFGFTPFYPGPGLGGHCIPIDPILLKWKARKIGIKTRFIELASQVNNEMPDYVIKSIIRALKTKNKSIKDSKVLLLGLAYKKNVDDCRESPSLVILNKLINKGARISYSDPHVPKFPKTRKFNHDLNSVNLNSEEIAKNDAVVLLTDHDFFNYKMILNEAKLIIDTRGKFRMSEDKIFTS